MTHRARQVITAGLAEQLVADTFKDEHSIFTFYLLEALNGAAIGSEGEITADQVMAYIVDAVQKDGRSRQTPAHGDLEDSEPGGNLIFQNPNLHSYSVPSDREGGINTGILVHKGDRLSILTSGITSFDSGNHFTNPDGMWTTYKGQILAHAEALKPFFMPHPNAYKAKGSLIEDIGIVGSLIGWIDVYSEDGAFFIGENREIIADKDGFLHLSFNDERGTYSDNQGEYKVIIKING
jgi:hypothetical protein